jgi:hypothetical protein
VAAECYLLADEHSKTLQLPPLFFPKISDLILWVSRITQIDVDALYLQPIPSLPMTPFQGQVKE